MIYSQCNMTIEQDLAINKYAAIHLRWFSVVLDFIFWQFRDLC